MSIPTYPQAILRYGYGLALAHMAEIGCLPYRKPADPKKTTIKEVK